MAFKYEKQLNHLKQNFNSATAKASKKINDFIPVAKEATKKATVVTGDFVKKAATKTVELSKITYTKVKEEIGEIKDNYETQKQIKYEQLKQDSILRYNGATLTIKRSDINAFLCTLDDEHKVLDSATLKKIKKNFPIPNEQNIIWADVDTGLRYSGIVVTDRGVFFKTEFSVKDELAVKFQKERSGDKQSVLTYYPWTMFGEGELPWDNEVFEQLNSNKASFLNSSNKYLRASLAGASAESLAGTAKMRVDNSFAHSDTGFGFMTEDYHKQADWFRGKNSKIIGNDNAKSGPDRLVNGIKIQTKYHKEAAGTLGEAFENGAYRYVDSDGKFIKFEVPKDQYADIKANFKDKVIKGEVKNISNPDDVDDIVIKGKLTHTQAVNLAKAGTIESIFYDFMTGSVVCLSAFGLSFLATSFVNYLSTRDAKYSVKEGLIEGAKTYGLAMTSYIVTMQLLRTEAVANLVRNKWLTNSLQPNTLKSLANITRITSGGNLVANETTKALRNEVTRSLNSMMLSSAVSFVIFSIPYTIKLCMNKISGSQYAKDLIKLGSSIVGGAAGSAAGAAIAVKAGATGMIAGTAGSMVGGVVGGIAVGAAVGFVSDILCEDDVIRYSRLFNAFIMVMSVEYLLVETEMSTLMKKLSTITPKQFTKLFEKVHSSKMQENTIREFLSPYFDEIIQERVQFDLTDIEIAAFALEN